MNDEMENIFSYEPHFSWKWVQKKTREISTNESKAALTMARSVIVVVISEKVKKRFDKHLPRISFRYIPSQCFNYLWRQTERERKLLSGISELQLNIYKWDKTVWMFFLISIFLLLVFTCACKCSLADAIVKQRGVQSTLSTTIMYFTYIMILSFIIIMLNSMFMQLDMPRKWEREVHCSPLLTLNKATSSLIIIVLCYGCVRLELVDLLTYKKLMSFFRAFPKVMIFICYKKLSGNPPRKSYQNKTQRKNNTKALYEIW